MTEFTSLTSILSTIELKLNGAMSVSNDQKLFNENINEIENLLKKTNALVFFSKFSISFMFSLKSF